jgi:hypothetical protein
MVHETLRRGRSVLRAKIDMLNEYLSIQVEGVGYSDRASVDADVARGQTALAGYPLPAGFRWVPLAQIELRQEPSDIQSAAEFRKTDKETMRRGFVQLQSEILPRLARNAACASDYFGAIDLQNEHDYEHGLQRVFDAFFGQDHVHLGRANAAGMFDVINGRHRIRLAQELGWDVVPAKLDQEASGA